MRKKTIGFYVITVAALIFFVGGADFSARAAKPQKTDKPQAEKKASVPLAVKGYGYNYSPKGKSDPFKPFMETDASVIKKKEEALKKKKTKLDTAGKTISPLQKADLNQFQLVGIAIDKNEKTAIVEDKSAKKHYPVFVGTYIGLNGGRIAEILADRFVVEEITKTDDDKTKKAQVKRIEVFLHKEQ
jgi:type IV pilus assembly protein PilP